LEVGRTEIAADLVRGIGRGDLVREIGRGAPGRARPREVLPAPVLPEHLARLSPVAHGHVISSGTYHFERASGDRPVIDRGPTEGRPRAAGRKRSRRRPGVIAGVLVHELGRGAIAGVLGCVRLLSPPVAPSLSRRYRKFRTAAAATPFRARCRAPPRSTRHPAPPSE
jgi:hypothetical protein